MTEKRRSPESYTEKEKWHMLSGSKKIRYIWDYYKLPVFILFVILYIAGYNIYGHVTHKEPVLYTGLVNIASGETLTQQLSDDFLTAEAIDTGRNEFTLYSGLYLTDDTSSEYHQYSYASHLKILGAIDAEKLDVVLMNREAFDAFSQNGYLMNLDEFFADSPLYETIKPELVTNIEVLEDNAMDVYYDDSQEFRSTTKEYAMGLDLSASPIIREAGLDGTVYLGIIANTPRREMAERYVAYLYSCLAKL